MVTLDVMLQSFSILLPLVLVPYFDDDGRTGAFYFSLRLLARNF
jgi:hypothetical protein